MFSSFSKANRTFHIFSGEDINIISHIDSPKLNFRFNYIGLSVLVICVSCLISAILFISNVLDGASKLWSVPIGLFWGFTVTIIYLLLLYTITPPLLIDRSMIRKTKKRKEEINKKIFETNLKKLGEWFSLSMSLRIGFILIFAVIIAQPLNYLCFKHKIKSDIELYKMELKSDMIYLSDSASIVDEKKLYTNFYKDISLLNLSEKDSLFLLEKSFIFLSKNIEDQAFLLKSEKLKAQMKSASQNVKNKSQSLKEQLITERYFLTQEQIENDSLFLENSRKVEFENQQIKKAYDSYVQGMYEIIETKHVNNQNISSLIDRNKFYLRSLVMLNQKSILVQFFNFFSILVFILPIIAKFQLRRLKYNKKSSFYQFKEKYEVDFVLKNYRDFKQRWELILQRKYKTNHIKTLRSLEPQLLLLEKYNKERAKEYRNKIDVWFSYKIEYYEKYLDPPFNLRERESRIVELTEDYFLKRLKEKEGNHDEQ